MLHPLERTVMARDKETFPMDGAKWPVIVIKNDGKVLLCNEAAKQQLHNGANGIGDLNVIWTDENGCSSEDFVKRISTTSISAYPLRLKTRMDEDLKHFTAHICIWPEKTLTSDSYFNCFPANFPRPARRSSSPGTFLGLYQTRHSRAMCPPLLPLALVRPMCPCLCPCSRRPRNRISAPTSSTS